MTSTSLASPAQSADARSTIATPSDAAQQAAKDTLPFVAALVPFAFAIGSASATAGLSAFESAFGAIALLAGASQLAAVEVMASGGGLVITVMLVTLINLRFLFYGAGLAQWFDGAPMHRRLLLAIPIVDQTFMLCQERFGAEYDLAWRQRYYVTASAILAGTFVTCQVIAYQVGAGLPDGLGLHLAAPLAFAGMLAKAIKGTKELVAGAFAGSVVVLGTGFAGAAALPLAIVAGVGAATFLARTPTDEETLS